MDNFYSFSDGAPAVYLEYARWLAANGIARASITGRITASNQSVSISGSNYIGTVTLTTDADLIRIPKSVGTLTGNSGGSDSSYYYVKSGDTIRVTSTSSRFAVSMESLSSDTEEANFLVGVPSVAIQKVLVPIYGAPNILKKGSVSFELSYGAISVTKKSLDGILLKGTVFELLNSAGTVVATATTNNKGIASFANLQPGSYTVREKTPSQGYKLAATSSQNVSVVAGVTATATFTNDRITGRVRIIKKDSVTEKPLAGAVFTVTLLSGPESDNASDIGKVVATITTNAQGIAKLAFCLGANTRSSKPVSRMATLIPAIPQLSGLNEWRTRDMFNMKRFLHLMLAVVMLLSCFQIPYAYADDEPVTVTLNVTNTPVRGDVALEKTGMQLIRFADEKDAYGNTIMKPVYQNGFLAGAVFELRAAEDIVGKEGTVFYKKNDLVETLTTSSTGAVKSKILPLGKYYLKEVSAPDGYVFETTPYNVTLAAVDKKTAVVEVKVSASNTYLPIRVTLRKQKEQIKITETKEGMVHQTIDVVAGEGFIFGLYTKNVITYGDAQKLPANTLVATGATDSKGNLTFSGMYPHGEYYLKEISVPQGWLLSADKYPVTLTSANKAANENVITVYLEDPILNHLIYTPVTITKTDITGAEKLPGALIEVFDADGNRIYKEYTNNDGELPNIPVVPGTYTFKETYAPSGYALNVAVKTFTVSADGKVTGETVIKDEVNKVMLKKTKDNGEPLPGAVFGLFDAKNVKVQEAVSDKDGSVVFTKIPYGSYTIRELSAPFGYHPSKEEWKITVDGTYVNPTKVLATVENQPAPGRIKVLKQDALDKHVIEGVQFDIFEVTANGTAGDLVATMKTGKDGIAESPDLFPADYIVQEHALPEGYEGTLWSEKITVGMDEVITRTVTNKPIQGKVRIVKTDSETGKGLPGAVFTVTRISSLPSHNGEGDGEIVAVITSGKDGTAETPLLTWGEYQIVETRVPDDYLDDGYSVTVQIPASAKTEENADPVK